MMGPSPQLLVSPSALSHHWIVGPGAIGRLLADALADRHAVTLIGRHASASDQVLIRPNGDVRRRALPLITPAEVAMRPRPDVIHLTTKAMTAEAALAAVIAPLEHSPPVLLWQNGYWVQPRLSRAYPGPVLCATTTEGAYLKSTGETGALEVVHAGQGQTLLGDLNACQAPLAQALAALLNEAGLHALAVPDIGQRLWHKLAINAAINPLAALHGVLNGALGEPPLYTEVAACISEMAPILAAEGIALPADTPDWHSLVIRVIEKTAHNRASMRQDLDAGRPTERQAILAPLIEAATRHRLECTTLVSLDAALARREAALGGC